MRLLLLTLFIFSFSILKAQTFGRDSFGVQVGITSEIGTHINRFGVKVQAYYSYRFVQINAGNTIRFNGTGLGERQNYITNRINTGIVLLAGKRTASPQLILDGLHHQSKHQYGLAYNYLWYFDNVGTSQRSGGFGAHIQQFSILLENDLFAGQGKDRFRTSYAALHYHNDLYNISLNTTLWTGETGGVRAIHSEQHNYPGGYKDLSSLHYGKTSHGIVYLAFDYHVFWGNSLSAAIGIDSEHIRNGLQNKFMHDKVFLPKSWRKPNANYPMLNIEGLPIHQKSEKKPNRFYFQAGFNRSLSY